MNSQGLESVSIRRIQVIGYGILEFLGVGTTFDIFQNILFPYSLNTAYCLSWIRRIGLVSFVAFGECMHGYAVSSLMDMAYWFAREPKRLMNQSVATPRKKIIALKSTVPKPKSTLKELYEHVSKTCSWWYTNLTPPGYKWEPKSKIGNVKPNVSVPLGTESRTTNILEPEITLGAMFVEQFLGTVRFGNDQFAPILRYGDLVQGNVTIKRVYYVEGLNHNLFSVGQFCDADLEVTFQKSTCYVHDLKGNDLLTGSYETDLYSITLQETTSPNPICLMAKASSSQACLWHLAPPAVVEPFNLEDPFENPPPLPTPMTSSAIPIGSEIERSANSSVMQVGVSSGRERVFQTEYGIRLMLVPRSAKALHVLIPENSQGMRNRPGSQVSCGWIKFGSMSNNARRHFKTLSLDELKSPDFNLLSNQEYSEEEVAKTMAETMEQYMSKTRADYGSGVARPKIKDKDNFELKGQFLKELRTNTFSGSDHEDANEHIEKVLEIMDLFHIPNTTIDQVMLRAFPMSLTEPASRWLRNKLIGSITTWEDMKNKFLSKYCPPARTTKKIEEINNFQQELGENLYQAWERFKELLTKCPQHYLMEMREVVLFDMEFGGMVSTRQIIDQENMGIHGVLFDYSTRSGPSTALKMTVPSTTEEKICKKNDVKARKWDTHVVVWVYGTVEALRARMFYQSTGKEIIIDGSSTVGMTNPKVRMFQLVTKLGHLAREVWWWFLMGDMAEDENQATMALMAFHDSEVLCNMPDLFSTARSSQYGWVPKAHLSDFKEFDGGYVTFGGGANGGRITGKGTIKTDKLDFEDVYFVKELKFNLFKVSQMCDKKNYVLFTDSECLVLSPNFKLPDESQVLLKIPRQNNMYSFDMKNIVPKDGLTCLVAKATSEESMFVARRLWSLARLEAIRIFLAYASYMGFTVYQMDVKSAFLYGKIEEEVYVQQKKKGIFISQNKYVHEILCMMLDEHLYRSMIRSLMYLYRHSMTDIMFAVCACARLIFLAMQSNQNYVATSTTEADCGCCKLLWTSSLDPKPIA
ncbi:retrovirus-related pol polyprotein from transposon TNT 1-94 [Tanacetum coccineum]|uniref:Retrovirus-related pol polyprotein from transposon TNT 1-94 n=1 Tax=Tanacetum coccineum TaxID=301880 RepID=A0ABQ5GE62_9ASTR